MSQWAVFTFSAADPARVDQFVDEYVLDAIDRLSDYPACESVTFAFASDPETGERSVASLVLMGDVDALADQERPRWDQAVAEGPISDWERARTMDLADWEEILGQRTARLYPEVAQLAAELATRARERFSDLDARPAPVDTYPDEESEAGPLGWWVLMHYLTVQLGYTPDEELAAYLQGIDHTLRNIAEHDGATAADERIDDIIADLEANREAITEGRRFTL